MPSLDPLPDGESWRDHAACASQDVDLWFPPREPYNYTPTANRARSVCRGDSSTPRCPVLMQCLLYALQTDERYGIWGGLSPRERGVLRRRMSLENYRITSGFPDEFRFLVNKWLKENENTHAYEQGSEEPPLDQEPRGGSGLG